MNRLPVIRDIEGISNPCARPAGAKALDAYCRTLPDRTVINEDVCVLQDELEFPILDELTGSNIFDDLSRLCHSSIIPPVPPVPPAPCFETPALLDETCLLILDENGDIIVDDLL